MAPSERDSERISESVSAYKTAESASAGLYPREGQPAKSPHRSVSPRVEDIDPSSVEGRFQEFGEVSATFVREVSAVRELSYRGEPGSVKSNVSITKKVFSKWSIEIIMSIYSLKSAGFADLRRLLTGISPRVLSKKLKDLEEMGLLDREVIEARPPKVRYTLSKRGEVLAKLGEPVIIYLRQSVR
jgi:DNA-binding HxlR family transcriptional regulator